MRGPIAVLILSLLATPLLAAGFTRVVSTDTPYPGSPGNFRFFGNPSLSAGTVAFYGEGPSRNDVGIFRTSPQGIQTIADMSTSIPGRGGTFWGFDWSVSCSGGQVAFIGKGNHYEGVFLGDGSRLVKVVDTETLVPGGSGTFEDFYSVSLRGSEVLILAVSGGKTGLYKVGGGTSEKLVDEDTPLGGGVTVGDLGVIRLPSPNRGEKVTFVITPPSSSHDVGVYLAGKGTLEAIATRESEIPDFRGYKFQSFASPTYDNGRVVFFGKYSNGDKHDGIYALQGILLVPQAGTGHLDPESGQPFVSASAPAVSGDHLAFLGYVAGRQHLYLGEVGGSFTRVLDSEDPLDGKSLGASPFILTRECLDGTSLVVQVQFPDGSRGIYGSGVGGGGGPPGGMQSFTGQTGKSGAPRSRMKAKGKAGKQKRKGKDVFAGSLDLSADTLSLEVSGEQITLPLTPLNGKPGKDPTKYAVEDPAPADQEGFRLAVEALLANLLGDPDLALSSATLDRNAAGASKSKVTLKKKGKSVLVKLKLTATGASGAGDPLSVKFSITFQGTKS